VLSFFLREKVGREKLKIEKESLSGQPKCPRLFAGKVDRARWAGKNSK
jgi:hypothetical protein